MIIPIVIDCLGAGMRRVANQTGEEQEKQEQIDISTGSLKKIRGRMPNCKSPGPDLVQGF